MTFYLTEWWAAGSERSPLVDSSQLSEARWDEENVSAPRWWSADLSGAPLLWLSASAGAALLREHQETGNSAWVLFMWIHSELQLGLVWCHHILRSQLLTMLRTIFRVEIIGRPIVSKPRVQTPWRGSQSDFHKPKTIGKGRFEP